MQVFLYSVYGKIEGVFTHDKFLYVVVMNSGAFLPLAEAGGLQKVRLRTSTKAGAKGDKLELATGSPCLSLFCLSRICL